MAINMRKATEAILTPGIIKEEHFSAACIPEGALQVDIIDTDKLKANCVTLAKSADDVRLHQFVGEETEVSVTGNTWVAAKIARFVKHPKNPATALRVIASLKTNDVLKAAHLGVFIDTVEELDLSNSSLVYDLVDGDIDISALANGRHDIEIKLKSVEATGESWNDHIDVMFIK